MVADGLMILLLRESNGVSRFHVHLLVANMEASVVVLSRQQSGLLVGCAAATSHGLAVLTQLHGFQVYDTSSLVRGGLLSVLKHWQLPCNHDMYHAGTEVDVSVRVRSSNSACSGPTSAWEVHRSCQDGP